MDVKALKGIGIVTIDGGEKVGEVGDVLFDLDQRRVRAFRLAGGRLGGSRGLVEASVVQSIGKDAIMIPDRSVIATEPEHARGQLPGLDQLTSLRVVTASGSFVGTVATAQIDPADGHLTALEVSRGGLISVFKKNLVAPIDRIISLGRDVAVVDDALVEAEGELPPEETQADRGGARP